MWVAWSSPRVVDGLVGAVVDPDELAGVLVIEVRELGEQVGGFDQGERVARVDVAKRVAHVVGQAGPVRDLVAAGLDAGVRLGERVAPDMVAIPVSGEQRQVIVGSPAYLKAHGAPQHPRDLAAHACIGWRARGRAMPYRWELVDRGREIEVVIDARVDTTDMGLMIRLARAGVGLTIGLEESLRPYLDRGELVTVLDKHCPPFAGFFLYYPKRAHPPLKLRALVEFLRARQRGVRVPPPVRKRKRR
jgi:DNA-binding transcriptional LysR family regulator